MSTGLAGETDIAGMPSFVSPGPAGEDGDAGVSRSAAAASLAAALDALIVPALAGEGVAELPAEGPAPVLPDAPGAAEVPCAVPPFAPGVAAGELMPSMVAAAPVNASVVDTTVVVRRVVDSLVAEFVSPKEFKLSVLRGFHYPKKLKFINSATKILHQQVRQPACI